MKPFILLLTCVIPTILLSQTPGDSHIAQINDPDGYTFVRAGEGTDYSVTDTLFAGDLFEFQANEPYDWWRVMNPFMPLGYMHKSRIQPLRKLSRNAQHQVLTSVFAKEMRYFVSKRPLESKWIQFHETTFKSALTHFVTYQQAQFDPGLMHMFFDLMILESGSADETPAWILGWIFLDHPDEVLALVKAYQSEPIRGLLDFGFLNVSDGMRPEVANPLYKRIQSIEITDD